MAGSINVVVLVGNLTKDPELRQMSDGSSVARLRLAVNERTKDRNTGEWGERPNYFDVDVFGAQAEQCGKWLTRGRQVAVEGRLRWREWEAQDGQKRSAVSVVASSVQFIGPREGGGQGAGNYASGPSYGAPAGTAFGRAAEPPQSDYAEAPDDDIPF